MENPDNKKMMIIEAATKRFAHFGLAKTTMNEIAQDLAFSKALLYYYFPDKNSLYKEVFLHITQKITTKIQVGLQKIEEPEDAMIYFLDQRQNFIQQYYNLLNYTQSKISDPPKALREIYGNAEKIEINTITTILFRANEKGKLKIENCEETAQLIFYSMIGIRFCILSKTSRSIFPSIEQLEDILSRQKTLILILLKGLKSHSLS